MVERSNSARPRRVYLTRNAFWFGAIAPPVLTLLLSRDVTLWVFADAKGWSIARKVIGIALYTNVLLAAHIVAFNEGIARLPLERVHRTLRLALYALISVGVVVSCTWAISPVLSRLAPGMVHDLAYLTVQGVVISHLWLAGTYTWRQVLARIREERSNAHREQLAALDARVRLLQVRTNPHFLYNSLNTVMSLIPTQPELAEETLGRLAGLFRYSLEQSERPAVSLEEEIRSVADYLSVEQVRFGNRLRYSIEVPTHLHHVQVPPMILQPLVENAVKHGVSQSVAGGRVSVQADVDEGELLLRVHDDGPGPEGSLHHGTGTSVVDLRERLGLLYGDRQRLRTGHGASGGYVAELRLPLGSQP